MPYDNYLKDMYVKRYGINTPLDNKLTKIHSSTDISTPGKFITVVLVLANLFNI